ncbi:MAG: tyrosine-type recombinase/integrase [Anaerolineaceae bacterium]|nr:tyrosine-type recombinase/integrase [Anaerolineaceae bacterium]
MVKIIKQENLPFITFHDLRHTTASLMINAGILIIEVSRLLGHSSINVTLDTYTHFIPSMHNEKANLIDDILNPID